MYRTLSNAYRGRRVLLIGASQPLAAFFRTALSLLGASIRPVSPSAGRESLMRALTAARTHLLLVPDLDALTPAALDTLLSEAREAGVPQVVLLSSAPVFIGSPPPGGFTADHPIGGECLRGLHASVLQMHVRAAALGFYGAPLRCLLLRHPPVLGGSSPVVRPYARWCRALLRGGVPHPVSPSRTGVFLAPAALTAAALWAACTLRGCPCSRYALHIGCSDDAVCPDRLAARILCPASSSDALCEDPRLPSFQPLSPGILPTCVPALCAGSAAEALDDLYALCRARSSGKRALSSCVEARCLAALTRPVC